MTSILVSWRVAVFCKAFGYFIAQVLGQIYIMLNAFHRRLAALVSRRCGDSTYNTAREDVPCAGANNATNYNSHSKGGRAESRVERISFTLSFNRSDPDAD